MKRIFFSLALLAVVTTTSYAQPGALDPTFGNSGKVVIDLGSMSFTLGYAVAVQVDGKILVAGQVQQALSNNDFLLVRYNIDGTLDNTFDGDGVAITDFYAGNDAAQTLVVQPDGKIVVAGFATNSGNQFCALVRYNTNGTLDNSFGTGGKAVQNYGTDESYVSLSLQTDGKILAGGTHGDINGRQGVVARHNVDGTIDINLIGGPSVGWIPIGAWGNNHNFVTTVIAQPDGKMLAGGYGYGTTQPYQFGMMRFNASGTLDNTFNQNGLVITDIYAGNDLMRAMALQPDGKILATGSASVTATATSDIPVLRYNSDGTPDNSFGNNGVAIVDISAGVEEARAIAIQPDGRIVLAGTALIGGGSDFDYAVARVNSNGTMDNSFDGDGKLTTAISTNEDIAYGTYIQADGKILVVGRTTTNSKDFTLVRYNGGTGVGIEDVNKNAAPNVYPNPGAGIFVIETTAKTQYNVTDIKGRTILTGVTANGKTSIDITKHADGIYLLQVGDKTTKLVKQ